MIGKSIKEGSRLVLGRFRLVVLIYVLNLILAFVFVFPVYRAVLETIGGTGFGAELMYRFDLVLWREIIVENAEGLSASFRRIVWVLPLLWVWKTATQMGLIYALHHGAIWPFWSGVFLHTPKGLLLSVFYLVLKFSWVVLVYVGLALVQPYFGGEVEMFWLMAVVSPFALLTGLAIIELYHRYGRLALVIRNDKVLPAIRTGFKWPGRSYAISAVYLFWYVVALIVFYLGMLANAEFHVGFGLLWVALGIQQVILLVRSSVTVGWVGSEVFLFEELSLSARR